MSLLTLFRAKDKQFTPRTLFTASDNGVWYDPSDTDSMNTLADGTGTTPSINDPVGLIADKSGSNNPGTQQTTAARPLLAGTPQRLQVDLVDDNLNIDFSGTGGFRADNIVGTQDGIVHAEVAIPNGTYNILYNPLSNVPIYWPGDSIVQYILRSRPFTADEVSKATAYILNKGTSNNFGSVTNMSEWFRNRTDIVNLYAKDWDTSNVTTFNAFAQNATALTDLQASNWDVSNVIDFSSFVASSNIKVLDVETWDTSSVQDFSFFVFGCSNLEVLNVSNWDTSSVTTFRSMVRDTRDLTTLDTSNWDTSNVTDFLRFAQNAKGLTTLDVSNWDTSSLNLMQFFAAGATNLTDVIVNGGTGNPFADSPCTSYNEAFTNTNLTQQSIDDILVAIEAANTSNGRFDQSGGSAPSVTGETAIDALRARGWTITVTGGY